MHASLHNVVLLSGVLLSMKTIGQVEYEEVMHWKGKYSQWENVSDTYKEVWEERAKAKRRVYADNLKCYGVS